MAALAEPAMSAAPSATHSKHASLGMRSDVKVRASVV